MSLLTYHERYSLFFEEWPGLHYLELLLPCLLDNGHDEAVMFHSFVFGWQCLEMPPPDKYIKQQQDMTRQTVKVEADFKRTYYICILLKKGAE